MKRSLFVTGLLLVAVIALGTWNLRRLTTLKREHVEILAAAARAGVPDAQSPTKSSIRLRDEADLQRALAECRAALSAGENLKDRIQLIASELSASSLRKLATAIGEDATLSTDQKGQIFHLLMAYAAEEYPEVVIELAMSHPGLFSIGSGNDSAILYFVETALTALAADDLESALGTAVRLKEKSPEITDRSPFLLSGTVVKLPPQRMLEWYRQMGNFPRDTVFESYFSSAKTREQQTERMTALRQFLDNMESRGDRNQVANFAFRNLGKAAAASGYEFGSGWMASANLSTDETQRFIGQILRERSAAGDTGRWIEWVNEKFPNGLEYFSTTEMVQSWSNNDYQAAGKWLASLPEGSIKNQALTGYIESVKNLDPEVAKQWALTLPPGPEREETLQRIQAK